MPRRDSRTYQRAAQAHSKVMAARQAMALSSPPAAEREEPMHRYVFPISPPAQPVPVQGEVSAALTQTLERLAAQEQLLTDLLGAVNSLTAVLLNQGPRG